MLGFPHPTNSEDLDGPPATNQSHEPIFLVVLAMRRKFPGWQFRPGPRSNAGSIMSGQLTGSARARKSTRRSLTGGPVTLFGFGNRSNVLSAQDSAEWFARVLGLAAAGTKTLDQAAGVAARQQDWASSAGHVRLITIEGGGHTVPRVARRVNFHPTPGVREP
jgi:hypothetical protein